MDLNQFDGRIDSVWRIKNQRGSIWPWSHERKLRKVLNEMFVFTFVLTSFYS